MLERPGLECGSPRGQCSTTEYCTESGILNVNKDLEFNGVQTRKEWFVCSYEALLVFKVLAD